MGHHGNSNAPSRARYRISCSRLNPMWSSDGIIRGAVHFGAFGLAHEVDPHFTGEPRRDLGHRSTDTRACIVDPIFGLTTHQVEDHLTKGSNWKKVTDIRSVAGLKVRIQLPFVSTKPDESVRDEQAGLLLGAENVEGSENNPGN